MQELAAYDGPGGVVAAVRAELSQRVDAARAAGIPDERIVLDPGLGFAKKAEHNWALLAGLSAACRPSASGCWSGRAGSRSSGSLLAGPDGSPRGVDDRESATTALTVLLAQQGVWGLRVHDVRSSRDALRALEHWEEASP